MPERLQDELTKREIQNIARVAAEQAVLKAQQERLKRHNSTKARPTPRPTKEDLRNDRYVDKLKGVAKPPLKGVVGAAKLTVVGGKMAVEVGKFSRANPKTAGTLAFVLAAPWLWVGADGAPDEDKACTNASNQLVTVGANIGPWKGTKNNIRQGLDYAPFFSDGRNWDEIAEKLSKERGYFIPPESLAGQNRTGQVWNVENGTAKGPTEKIATLAISDSEGKIDNRISSIGSFCIKVPGPLPQGLIQSDGETTISDYAKQNFMKIEDLRVLNTGLSKDDGETVREGEIIRLTANPNTQYIFRKMEEKDLYDVVKGNQRELDEIYHANRDTLALGGSLKQGSYAYLPYEQTPEMKEKNITPVAVVKAYTESYKQGKTGPGNPSQRIIGPAPKPKTSPKAPKTPEKAQALDKKAEYDRIVKFGTPPQFANMYITYGEKYNIPPKYLAAQGKAESGWRPDAVGPQTKYGKAKGMAQFLDSTFAGWRKRLNFPPNASPFDPRYAIEAQAAMMAGMYHKCLDRGYARTPNEAFQCALVGYFSGFDDVEYYQGLPTARELARRTDVLKDYMVRNAGYVDKLDGKPKAVAKPNTERAALQSYILKHPKLSLGRKACGRQFIKERENMQKRDISSGVLSMRLLTTIKVLLDESGASKVIIRSLKSDHHRDKGVHPDGNAVDIENCGKITGQGTRDGDLIHDYLIKHHDELGLSQYIWKSSAAQLCLNHLVSRQLMKCDEAYDKDTLDDHADHQHVGLKRGTK